MSQSASVEDLAPAVALGVRPSSLVVPENLLRLYITFTEPMLRQRARDHLRLSDSDGRDVSWLLLDFGTELWSADSTRLTVLLHPGLTKRGLPRSGEGLAAGQHVRLTVEEGWPTQRGDAAQPRLAHDYQIAPAQRTALDPAHWRVSTPQTATRDELVVWFDRVMDAGLLRHRLIVLDSGLPLHGRGTVDRGERSWRFRPASPWSRQGLRLTALPGLEDCCGNGLDAPFEQEIATRCA